jgi:DNA-binding LytR/AlgR family response regulator
MNDLKLLRVVLFVKDGIARDAIIFYFGKYYPLMEIVGMYEFCDGAQDILEKHNPDIVIFQQRKMKNLSGELYYAMNLDQCVHSEMADAEDLFAHKGNYNIANILHDPVDLINFRMVIDNNVVRYFEKNPKGASEYYRHAKMLCPPAMQTINIHIIGEGFKDIMLGDISVLKGHKQQSKMFLTTDDKIHITSKSLGRLEGYLPPDMFLQIAKSYKVNGFNILKYRFDKIGYITMKNYPKELKVNGDYNTPVYEWIKKYRKDLLEE